MTAAIARSTVTAVHLPPADVETCSIVIRRAPVFEPPTSDTGTPVSTSCVVGIRAKLPVSSPPCEVGERSVPNRPDGSVPNRPDGSVPNRPDGSVPNRPDGSVPNRPDDELRAIAVTAVKALLEVLDRRRPSSRLTVIAVPRVIEQVSVLAARNPVAAGPAAVLERLHLQLAHEEAVEVSATFRRGRRVHAIAIRIEMIDIRQRAVPGGRSRRCRRWRIVALATD